MTNHTLLIGDNRHTLTTLPDNSVHAVVTSPPYWKLREYATADGKHLELGREATVDEYIANLLTVFREVRRCLRTDGVFFLNIGDTYTNGNLENVPHRVASALQADGWIWRSTIIWKKISAMPESISGWRWMRCRVKINGHQRDVGWSNSTDGRPQSDSRHEGPYKSGKWAECQGCDKCRRNNGYVLRKGSWRPTCGHEYVFMFTKTTDYFCDSEAAAEAAVGGAPGNKTHKYVEAALSGNASVRRSGGLVSVGARQTRNPRSVWTFSNEPVKEKHFACFPTMLVYRLLKPVLSPGGVCSCGAPYAPIVSTDRFATRPGNDSKVGRVSPFHAHSGAVVGNRDPQRHVTVNVVNGYLPTCGCGGVNTGRRVVLDPFAGLATTGRVAKYFGADFIGCELSQEYAAIAEQKLAVPWVPKSDKKKAVKRKKRDRKQLELFE